MMGLFDRIKKNKWINIDSNEVIDKTTYSITEREYSLNTKVKNNLKVAY